MPSPPPPPLSPPSPPLAAAISMAYYNANAFSPSPTFGGIIGSPMPSPPRLMPHSARNTMMAHQRPYPQAPPSAAPMDPAMPMFGSSLQQMSSGTHSSFDIGALMAGQFSHLPVPTAQFSASSTAGDFRSFPQPRDRYEQDILPRAFGAAAAASAAAASASEAYLHAPPIVSASTTTKPQESLPAIILPAPISTSSTAFHLSRPIPAFVVAGPKAVQPLSRGDIGGSAMATPAAVAQGAFSGCEREPSRVYFFRTVSNHADCFCLRADLPLLRRPRQFRARSHLRDPSSM